MKHCTPQKVLAQARNKACWLLTFLCLAQFARAQDYCVPLGNNTAISGINHVIFNDIDNSSAIAPNYSDFTALATNVTAGTSYDLSVQVYLPYSGYVQIIWAWIDWNQNGDFEDTERYELGFVGSSSDQTISWTSNSPMSITVPWTALPGTTRMRIRTKDYFYSVPIYPTPCGDDYDSEAEDYTLNVIVPQPCSGTPAPGYTPVSTPTPCPGNDFTLGIVHPLLDTGLTFQWQSSTAGVGGPFANNGLGTGETQVTSATVPTWYRYLLTCSGNTGTSTPVLVTPTLTEACPPPNDECADAIALPVVNAGMNCDSMFTGNLAHATNSGITPCEGGSAEHDVWYSFTATATGHNITWTANTGINFTMDMGVYSGTCDSLVYKICTDSPGTFSLVTTVGTTYYIEIYGEGYDENMTFGLCIGTGLPVPPPANDNCADAIPLACGSVTSGTTSGANNTDAPTGCALNLGTSPGVWYTVEGNGYDITAYLCGTNMAAKIGIFTGSCGNFTCVASNYDFCIWNSPVTWASTLGTTYYIYATGYDNLIGDFNLTLNCPTCVPPAATATVVPNCPSGFDLDVDITSFGSGASATINYSVNGTAQTPISVPTLGTTHLTGFASGDDVDVTVAHESDSTCDVVLNDNIFGCPPANDECAGAFALPVNPDLNCGSVTHGSVLGATNSGLDPCITGSPDDDVWFSFTATTSNHLITLTNISGSSNEVTMAMYSGTCGNLTNMECSILQKEIIANGLTVGDTYWVQVYTLPGDPGQTSEFDICVGTFPVPANDSCAGAVTLLMNPDLNCGSVTHGTLLGATGSGPDPCNGLPDDDVWFSFTATTTSHQISLLNVGNIGWDLAVYSGTCGLLVNVACSQFPTMTASNLTAGDTYYVQVYSAGSGATSREFDICVGRIPAAPPNDNCANATALTVNPDLNCGSVTGGHVGNATGSGWDVCAGTADDDVWFSFTASATSHQISLTNITGSTSDLVMAVYAGVCNSPVIVACSNPETMTLNDLTAGFTYLVQVYTMTGTSGQTSSFDVCVGTPIDCEGVLNGPAQPGTTCDDGDASTGGDVYDANCNCAGQLIDCEGTPGGSATIGTACDDGDASTGNDVYDANCNCAGTPIGGPCSGNQIVVHITTDATPAGLSWQIHDSGNALVASGAPTAANSMNAETACLGTTTAPGCYTFTLFDSFGDGITNGGWELRNADGDLILRDNFPTGSQSPSATPQWSGYGSGHPFCLPLGPAHPKPSECGIFTNGPGNKVYSNKVTGASLYQFEFSDPDAGYTRRQARPTNRIHFWDLDPYPLTPGVTYFARVRTDVAGPLASAHFGTGCEMGLAVTVPCSQLISAPNYGHSCNETREFGRYGFIYATPVPGADAYEFRIYNTSEGYDETFTRSTYILHLKWPASEAPGLVNGSTYNVDVNVINGGVESGFCGTTCTITIQNAANFAGQLEQTGFGAATLWPNPVRDGQVNMQLTGLTDHDQRIGVAVYNVYGEQVLAKDYGNTGAQFSTVLDLPGSIASGIYMVHITVNGNTTIERLGVIR